MVGSSTRPPRSEYLASSISAWRSSSWPATDGWYGPDSKAPSPEVIEALTEVASYVGELPFHVSISALPEGGVHLEWEQGGWDYTAELTNAGAMYRYKLDLSTREYDEDREDDHYDTAVFARFLRDGVLV